MKKLAILLMILILALAACGGGDDSDSDTDEGTDTEQTTSQTTEETAAVEEIDVTEESAEEPTEEAEEVEATEEATETEEAEEVEMTEEADATEEVAETEEAEEVDATEEATETEEAEEVEMTEEAGEETESAGPVTISGWESLEEGCPTLFQFQHPPSWTITRSGGARVTFEIANDSGVSEGLIEYRGGIAPNQIETNYQRLDDTETASVIYTLTFDGVEYPVYKDERSTNSGEINYYNFFLPGRNLADNVRMTIEPDESGAFPPDEDIIQMLSTIIPNSCF